MFHHLHNVAREYKNALINKLRSNYAYTRSGQKRQKRGGTGGCWGEKRVLLPLYVSCIRAFLHLIVQNSSRSKCHGQGSLLRVYDSSESLETFMTQHF